MVNTPGNRLRIGITPRIYKKSNFFLGVSNGTGRSCLMKIARVKKSCDTVPLRRQLLLHPDPGGWGGVRNSRGSRTEKKPHRREESTPARRVRDAFIMLACSNSYMLTVQACVRHVHMQEDSFPYLGASDREGGGGCTGE
jgi:hypothetical protein